MQPERPEALTPRMSAISDAVNFLAVYGTLTFLASISIYLVAQASQGGFYAGVRSFAGVLLPVIVGSFLYLYDRERLDRLGSVSTAIAFFSAMAVGVVVMLVLQYLLRRSAVPLAELVLSACFSVLVFSSRTVSEPRALIYYYGVISGMLAYVILLGFPLLG